jgi:menaquinol-cytochrome c reductase cytochrome b/c subunit
MAHDHFRDRIPGTPRFREKDKKKPIGTEPFFPNFLLKEWIVGSLFLVAFMLWIIFNPVELGPKADPTDTSFTPMPDWYFYFLYQLLKYFPGDVLWVGSVVVPGVAMTLLALAPWLDNSKARHPFKRPGATISMVVTLLLMIWMTYEAKVQHEEHLASQPKKPKQELPTDTTVVDEADPGAKVYAASCAGCHGADLKGQLGPMLLGIGNKYDEAKLVEVITKGFPPNMPPKGGLAKDEDVKAVSAWLAKQKQK